MKTSWDTADSSWCLSWLYKVRAHTCKLLHYWSWLNGDCPQVSWTCPKPQCWLWAVEDWAARWHCTLLQQASVGWILFTRKYLCFVCKLFLGEGYQNKHSKLLCFTSPLSHFSNWEGKKNCEQIHWTWKAWVLNSLFGHSMFVDKDYF